MRAQKVVGSGRTVIPRRRAFAMAVAVVIGTLYLRPAMVSRADWPAPLGVGVEVLSDSNLVHDPARPQPPVGE